MRSIYDAQVFLKAYAGVHYGLRGIHAHVAEVPRFIGYAGYVGLAVGIAKYKAILSALMSTARPV